MPNTQPAPFTPADSTPPTTISLEGRDYAVTRLADKWGTYMLTGKRGQVLGTVRMECGLLALVSPYGRRTPRLTLTDAGGSLEVAA